MSITVYKDLEQGTPEWFKARLGVVTASQVKLILTPTLKVAKNDKVRAYAYELAAQRENGWIEPHYSGGQCERGHFEEPIARDAYSENYAPAYEEGFITNDEHGFTMGFSPDGLVGDDGVIEIKSRLQKFQVETIAKDEVPAEYMLQIQTALLVSRRAWCDFVQYSNGMPMFVKRVYPDMKMIKAIIEAVSSFEEAVEMIRESYRANASNFITTDFIDMEISE